MQLQICTLGSVPYGEALDLQFRLLALRQADLIDDTLLLLEHPAVITLGTRGQNENIYRDPAELAADGVEIHRVGRGGDVTYHGPGQLIVYPIVKLYHRKGGIRLFIQSLEQAVIDWLDQEHGIAASAGQGKLTGIWVDQAKIMAVGLAVKQGVTMHGLALNINTDLTPFSWINPCGLQKPVTSLQLLTKQPVDFIQARVQLGQALAKALDDQAVWLDRQQLLSTIEKLEIQTAKDAVVLKKTAPADQTVKKPYQRKPEWLKAKSGSAGASHQVRKMLRDLNLHTVCEEAGCPNCGECFSRQTATFLVMGSVCSRDCQFCQVEKGSPGPLDPSEPDHIAEAVQRLKLRHVVITSVTRDDLPDGGADHFARIIGAIRQQSQADAPVIEVLIPDFLGRLESLETVARAHPEIINHNIETVPRLYSQVRPSADYQRSLELLGRIKQLDPNIISKSGLMVGLGETADEVRQTLQDLRSHNCDILTIGQYLAPSKNHIPVDEYIHPDIFAEYRRTALAMGFQSVAAGPLVRSSYLADQAASELLKQRVRI